MACFAALVALLFFAIPAQADEIEPESEPAPQAEPEAEPEPEPEPEPVPDVVSEEEEEFSEPAWIPSLDVGFEGFSYDVDTTIVNLSDPDPSSRSDTQPESVNQVVFRIGGGLMGPMFENLPGRPRLFVQGGVGFNAYSSDRVFEIDDPDVRFEPEAGIDKYQRLGAGNRVLPEGFEGQGSRLDADFQDPLWYAGLGIAFSVPTSGGLLFYIKPSVQYSAEPIDFTGKLKTVEEPIPRLDPDPCGVNEPSSCLREFKIRESNADFSTTDHSIGPGLEVAMAFRSFGPIRISVFGQARVLWLVSDAVTSFTDPNGFASYSVERNDRVFKGGVGVRLSWVGFD
jgi:hypothetical protein